MRPVYSDLDGYLDGSSFDPIFGNQSFCLSQVFFVGGSTIFLYSTMTAMALKSSKTTWTWFGISSCSAPKRLDGIKRHRKGAEFLSNDSCHVYGDVYVYINYSAFKEVTLYELNEG